MGDLGYLDEQGRVWFCGRKAHRVVTTGTTYFTIPCEAIFNTHPDVFRTALVGVGGFGGQRPVLCIELEKGADTSSLEKIHQELIAIGAEHEVTSQIKTFLFHPEFPVDIRHNAKIFREKLALWAEEKLS
jgi:acyl-coenzyme A synthetase/AMP-(fatty) acid ligase